MTDDRRFEIVGRLGLVMLTAGLWGALGWAWCLVVVGFTASLVSFGHYYYFTEQGEKNQP